MLFSLTSLQFLFWYKCCFFLLHCSSQLCNIFPNEWYTKQVHTQNCVQTLCTLHICYNWFDSFIGHIFVCKAYFFWSDRCHTSHSIDWQIWYNSHTWLFIVKRKRLSTCSCSVCGHVIKHIQPFREHHL